MFGISFVRRWQEKREDERRAERRLKELEIEERDAVIGLKNVERNTKEIAQIALRRAEPDLKRSADGNSIFRSYVFCRRRGLLILDMPDDQRSIFHDVLKGFEDYARLKGYSIQFSIDSAMPNKIEEVFCCRTKKAVH